MMLPLLHHGMMIVGIPYTESRAHDDANRRHALRRVASCALEWRRPPDGGISADEQALAIALGARLARTALHDVARGRGQRR